VTTADLDRDGRPEIIAGGQVGPKKSHRGCIGVYRQEGNRLVLLAWDEFSVSYRGETLPARVRAAAAVQDPLSGQWEIYAAGRGGGDETGIGFLRKSLYLDSRGEKKLREVDTHVFHSPRDRYSHGYPLVTCKLAGEERVSIVYGGFSGGPAGDRADVRVFRTGAGETLEKDFLRPFETLAVPMRVNALAAGDIDGDGSDDILAAGRTKTASGEKASFACRCGGKVYYRVLEEEDASRFRTLLIADLDNDGKKEIITGGRLDAAGMSLARLECWHLEGQSFRLISRYTWTADGSTRLRAFARHHGKNIFYAAGRTELVTGEERQWQGFTRGFTFNNGRLLPLGKPLYIKIGRETRVRHVVFFGEGQLLTAGFGVIREKKEGAFIRFVPIDCR
jgi:hypothetical protein